MKRIAVFATALVVAAHASGCVPRSSASMLEGFSPPTRSGERVRVLELYPGVIATIVAPSHVDPGQRTDLILYALPNGNSTAETIGRRNRGGANPADWRYDIQHIGAQTRALRARGLDQAIVVYLETNTTSWPEWRRVQGYDRANARIVAIVDQVRAALGNPDNLAVTLASHSGGGSFAWGFIEGQPELPDWLERIAFLDSNYSFEPQHGERIAEWLHRDAHNQLVVVAYDDREIMVDGKKVVSDSGGTWRASQRMMEYFRATATLEDDTLGDFLRYRAPQMGFLLHPNPQNRILHTAMIGDMNAYMHALLIGRPDYDDARTVLKSARAYTQYIEDDVILPAATPPSIPVRPAHSMTGSEFIRSIADVSREDREAATLRELMNGNIPTFLRALVTVRVADTAADGSTHVVAYEVMPDYLAIGSDDDFVRMPMNPYTAQAFCDAFGFVLPTPRMVNDIWSAAAVRVEPSPLTEARESAGTFLQHDGIIDARLRGTKRGALVAGIKKDVVITNRLLDKASRVAIFGWHHVDGQPIQPLYVGHVDWYVDYSHGIRPVRRSMVVDGVRRPFDDIVKDPVQAGLVSDEGVMAVVRYDRMER
jgi:hypothetical protein